MKRIIRLTEDDLTKIVKKVINEQKKLDEAFFDKKITSDEDKKLSEILDYIENTFNPKNLSVKSNYSIIKYRLHDETYLEIEDTSIPVLLMNSLIVRYDNKVIDCSYSMAKKIRKFLVKKFDEMENN